MSAQLLAALGRAACYPHPVCRTRLIQTHISWVLLTGNYAYKIKKPVDLGFLDFTTLAARRHYCEEELRLNRRLAPELYLEVVPITGTPGKPVIGGTGAAIEYAVKMKEFAQSALLDNAIACDEIKPADIKTLARTIADFHARLVPDSARAGDPDISVLPPARENFEQMLQLPDAAGDSAALSSIRDWTLREYGAHSALFEQRHAEGFVRECHGDLHLGNIALIDGAAMPFDCLEFNPALRWMDVMSEVAFLMMDLAAHRRRDLAFAFVNTYLEAGGDYAGVRLLPFYLVYRAVVRAKINLMRAAQDGMAPEQRDHALAGYRRYLALAALRARDCRGAVVITHGLSGSGKTTLTGRISSELGAIRVRSDIERKRLRGLPAPARTSSGVGKGMYTDDETVLTYDRLLAHARVIAGAGFPVIVDATFLQRAQRDAFHGLALELGLPFAIVNVTADAAELRARVAARAARENDASEATLPVLDMQIANREPLTADEMPFVIDVRSSEAAAARALCDALMQRVGSISMEARATA